MIRLSICEPSERKSMYKYNLAAIFDSLVYVITLGKYTSDSRMKYL